MTMASTIAHDWGWGEGAVLVTQDGLLAGVGYNSVLRRFRGSPERETDPALRAVFGTSAIEFLVANALVRNGHTVYCWPSLPDVSGTKLLVQYGVSRIVTQPFIGQLGLEAAKPVLGMCREADIKVSYVAADEREKSQD